MVTEPPPRDEPTSGNEGFDHFIRKRFKVKDCRVVMTAPEPLFAGYSQAMTPEQAEFLAARIVALAKKARAERYAKMPGLYPEDAPGQEGEKA